MVHECSEGWHGGYERATDSIIYDGFLPRIGAAFSSVPFSISFYGQADYAGFMRYVALVFAVLLGGCLTYNVNTFEAVDPTEKTITVPPGGGLTGSIKQALTRDGWRVIVRAGPEVTQGQLGAETRLERSKTFTTRYVMLVRWSQFDTCLLSGAAYSYDISLVDNRSGSEVLTLSGQGCETKIVDKLMEAVQAKK